MKEIWKICNENSNYSVSNLGNVKNNKTNNILKICENHNGYGRVDFQGKKYVFIN